MATWSIDLAEGRVPQNCMCCHPFPIFEWSWTVVSLWEPCQLQQHQLSTHSHGMSQSSLVFHQKRPSTSGTSQLLRKVDEQRNVSQVPFPGIRRPKFGHIVVPAGFVEGKLPTFATCLKFPLRQVQVPLETMTTTAALTQSLSVKCVKLLEASAASHGSN